MVTQPLMYKNINQHPGTRKLYADRLAAQGVIAADEADRMVASYRQAMDGGTHTNATILSNFKPPFAVDWSKYRGTKWNENDDTTLPLARPADAGGAPDRDPAELQAASARGENHRRPPPDGAGQAAGGLGHGGEPRLCLAAQGRLLGAHLRPGLPGAARSSTATPCCTTRTARSGTPAATSRCSTSRPTRAISSSSIRCCRRRRCWVSNTATRPPSRTSWWSGRRSSATSSTARRW